MVDHRQWLAREEVIRAVFELAAARQHNDIHSEDPHSEDNVDLHDAVLDDALANYVAICTARIPNSMETHPMLRSITSDD